MPAWSSSSRRSASTRGSRDGRARPIDTRQPASDVGAVADDVDAVLDIDRPSGRVRSASAIAAIASNAGVDCG
jgi:hypothetical protein